MKQGLLLVAAMMMSLAASAQSVLTPAQCTAAMAAPSVEITSGLVLPIYTDNTVIDGTIYGYVMVAQEFLGGNACSNDVLNVTIPLTGTHTVALAATASTTLGVTYAIFRASTPAPPTGFTATVN